MNFGQKLRLKKSWEYNEFLTFESGEIFQVAQYERKYGMKLHHNRISDLLVFHFDWANRDNRIEEYFEVIQEFDDRLAELEKTILDYYLKQGYQLGTGDWNFKVYITSEYKNKEIRVVLIERKDDGVKVSIAYKEIEKTTKEMYDNAFSFFNI